MLKKYLDWKCSDNIDQVAHALLTDRVVVGSSDTVLGLLANVTQGGFTSLNAIKQRADKPYIVLIDKIDKLKHFVLYEPSQSVLNLLQNCWPGPLTMIFKAKPDLPSFLTSSDHKIAIRIPGHAGLLKLLTNFEGLFSTSANLAGQPVPGLPAQLDLQIMHNVDLVIIDSYNLDHRADTVPSTILDCSTDQIKIIRSGAYPLDQLEKIYGSKIG
jgi:tRNA threonylcarbamoyl adenosine modification protein (Sua5/YciO/YrdC/YwlC family)